MKRCLILFLVLATLALCRAGLFAAATNAPVRVAIYVDAGARNTGVYRFLELTASSKDLTVLPVDAKMIREGVLAKTDVLVMPGGSATLQARTLGTNGCARIRSFVRRGGGYLGICAGCFLALEREQNDPEMLHLLPFRSDAPTGKAELTVRFNSRAEALCGISAGRRTIRFAEGPVMYPSLPVENAEFEIIAMYDSDINPCGDPPRASFAGQAAVVAGRYGKGRVFASAVHPEYSLGNQCVLRGAFKFLTGRNVSWNLPQRKRGQLAVGFVTLKSFGVETARFIQEQVRTHAFDFRPINRESLEAYALDHLDALVAPGGTDLPFEGPVFTNVATVVSDLRRLAAEPPPALRPFVKAKVAKPVRVALFADNGGVDFCVSSRLVRSPGFELTALSGRQIADGALKDFDLLIQPGGSCKTQCQSLGEKGCAEVVRFIREGGKYYGICAGAFMASQVIAPDRPRLGFVPYKDEDEPVYRGGCAVNLRLTEAGRAVFRGSAETRMVEYHGGPVFVPGDPLPDTDVKVLLTYDCEALSTESPEPLMRLRGKGAFLGGRVGKGKVFISAPHPEGCRSVDDLVDSGVEYLTGVRPDPVPIRRNRGTPVVRFRTSKEAEVVNFYFNRLMTDPRFDVRRGGAGFALRNADVCIVTCPQKKGELTGELPKFVDRGGCVLVLANTAEKRKAIKGCDRRFILCATCDELLEKLSGI